MSDGISWARERQKCKENCRIASKFKDGVSKMDNEKLAEGVIHMVAAIEIILEDVPLTKIQRKNVEVVERFLKLLNGENK